jgi:putative hemolysin
MKRTIPFTILLMTLAACSTLRGEESKPAATGTSLANMPNPASVFCERNGNKLEIRTAADGSQSGVCVFPDGSECDEWAYFRGECGQAAHRTPAADGTIEATADAYGGGKEVKGAGGFMAPGTSEAISDWWGVIKSTEPGAQYDDFFERQDLGQIISFGIDSKVPAVQAQIKALRDSGKIVHLYGTLLSNVPDYNGSQILVDRIEVEGE